MVNATVLQKFVTVIASHMAPSNKVNAGAKYVRLSCMEDRSIYIFSEPPLSQSDCRGNR
jgi:hypothetical protein